MTWGEVGGRPARAAVGMPGDSCRSVAIHGASSTVLVRPLQSHTLVVAVNKAVQAAHTAAAVDRAVGLLDRGEP